MSKKYLDVFILSLISNAIRKSKGSVTTLQDDAQKTIPLHVKDRTSDRWEVVWGPVVWKTDPDITLTGPDHVWYAAKKRYSEQYTVAVAGSATTYNHFAHNVDVVQVVDFPTWIGKGPLEPPVATPNIVQTGTYIALGTARGVHTLRSQPGRSHTDVIQSLPSFLQTLPQGSEVIFTGFSLGGTLSPTLALTLKQGGIFSQTTNVLTFPIAGASPGNDRFATLFESNFPVTGRWNRNIINKLDIIPYAWCTDNQQTQNLGNIPPIYGTPIVAGVEKVINKAKELAWKSRITYYPLPTIAFTVKRPKTTPTTVKEFSEEVKRQHGAKLYIKVIAKLIVKAGSQPLAQDPETEQEAEAEAEVEVGVELEEFFPDLEMGFI